MCYFLTLLTLAILASSACAQTLKSLMFNSNAVVVANTGTNVLTFSNDVKFGNGDLYVSGQVISGSGVSISFEDGSFTGALYMDGGDIQFANSTNAAATRANLGFSTNLNTAVWTATNASVNFNNQELVSSDETVVVGWNTNGLEFGDALIAAGTRTNLSLGLPALTNTSNVTMMRALAGSTNTNEPFSGTIQYADHPEGDVYVMTVSNGLILKTELQP